jgi:hypothetical protein
MSAPRIAELRFAPKRLSPWAALRVGMTREEACAVLGPGPSREFLTRVRQGQIIFHPPLQVAGQPVLPGPKPAEPSRGHVRYVNKDPAALRPCICCRRSFESSGPGNRMCERCRGRDVSPFEP